LLFEITPSLAIFTLSLHDALPISWFRGLYPLPSTGPSTGPPPGLHRASTGLAAGNSDGTDRRAKATLIADLNAMLTEVLNVLARSEEHTSELQSRVDLVCRLLLEK